MTTRWMRLIAILGFAVATLARTAHATEFRRAILADPAGTLRVEQDLPCNNHFSRIVAVSGGRLELSPPFGIAQGGHRIFSLVLLTVRFDGFSASAECGGLSASVQYAFITVQLERSVSFTAIPTRGSGYTFTIPAGDVLLEIIDRRNGQLERGFKRPSQDVTGSIDLGTGAFSMHVVIVQTTHVAGGGLDEDDRGTLTADVSGTLAFPDTDADGVPDHVDNCRFFPNADQSPVATPVVAAPADVTRLSCLDHRLGGAAAKDVCDGGPVTIANDAPRQFHVGSNVVTWTATDSLNRTATDRQIVTIVDETRPTFIFVPPDRIISNCGPVELGPATATDDCAGSPAITNDAPGSFPAGTTVVTWTATDASGNASTAFQTVTVRDTVGPAVACTPAHPLGTSFVVTGRDACGGALVLKLGSYTIANGEQIKIEETGQPGVRLQNVVGKDGLRKFFVGKGQAVILATDGAGNTSSAACVYPK
jgi:hypothetical protein